MTASSRKIAMVGWCLVFSLFFFGLFTITRMPPPPPEVRKESPVAFTVTNTYYHAPEVYNIGMGMNFGMTIGAAAVDRSSYCNVFIRFDSNGQDDSYTHSGGCLAVVGTHYTATGIFMCGEKFCRFTGIK